MDGNDNIFLTSFSTISLHTQPPESCWKGGYQRHIVPPITVAATFELPLGEEVEGEPVYGRYGHPSRCHLEQVLAGLEGCDYGLVFSSGMAAAHAVLQTLVPGDHIVAARCLYGGVLNMIRQLTSSGINVTFVDTSDGMSLEDAVTDITKIVWLEVCSNPNLKILDMKQTVERIRKANKNTIIVVDNTFLTPWVIKPLDLGADIVMHSVTKYLNGHSDVVMGALMIKDKDLHSELYKIQKYKGATPSPFDCFLVLRSLATFELRMERHMTSGKIVAEFLSTHPKVKSVTHPLLLSHPQQELTFLQHKGRHSGMVAFELETVEAGKKFLSNLKVVKNAASLGSSHSLACQPARLTHAMCSPQERAAAGVTDGLIRISVGLENVQDIIDDLKQALENIVK